MNLKEEIIKYLKLHKCKVGFEWKEMNFVNGFLVNLKNFNQKMYENFVSIMQEYVDKGYFTVEQSGFGLCYKLTEFGFKELVL